MKKRRKYTPYVRRANGHEKAESFIEAYRLAFYLEMKEPFFVMVQHGFPNLAIGVGATKKEVQKSPLVVLSKKKTFKQWASSVGRKARG